MSIAKLTSSNVGTTNAFQEPGNVMETEIVRITWMRRTVQTHPATRVVKRSTGSAATRVVYRRNGDVTEIMTVSMEVMKWIVVSREIQQIQHPQRSIIQRFN